MLELTPRPQFTVVVPPKLLQEGYLVNFTKAWPSTLTHVADKTFRIEAVNQVPYPRGYIIPVGDYRDVDLSNGSGTFQEKIYPTRDSSLFEVALGLRPGNYLVQFLIPADRYFSGLEYTGMTPLETDPDLVYIGARKPEDSPPEDTRIKFYLVKNMEPLILRVFVLPGVPTSDFEKCVLEFTVNKCDLREITQPTDEQLGKAKILRYVTELKFA